MANDQSLKTKYILEIYEPNNDSCVAASFESETPFMSLAKGDYLHPGFYEMTDTRDILEIVSLEHIFYKVEDSHQTQKVCVRTKVAVQPFE